MKPVRRARVTTRVLRERAEPFHLANCRSASIHRASLSLGVLEIEGDDAMPKLKLRTNGQILRTARPGSREAAERRTT